MIPQWNRFTRPSSSVRAADRYTIAPLFSFSSPLLPFTTKSSCHWVQVFAELAAKVTLRFWNWMVLGSFWYSRSSPTASSWVDSSTVTGEILVTLLPSSPPISKRKLAGVHCFWLLAPPLVGGTVPPDDAVRIVSGS